jgi:UrcA family protein
MNRNTIIAAVAAFTFLAVAPAHAASGQTADPYKDRPTVVVKIADLDLADAHDQDIMVRRIDRAARRICFDGQTIRERRVCARETVAYTLNLVPAHVRQAYAAASDRRESFALAQN